MKKADLTHISLPFTLTRILVALNNKNPESDIGVNAESQGSKGPSAREFLCSERKGDPVLYYRMILHYRLHLSPPSLRLQ